MRSAGWWLAAALAVPPAGGAAIDTGAGLSVASGAAAGAPPAASPSAGAMPTLQRASDAHRASIPFRHEQSFDIDGGRIAAAFGLSIVAALVVLVLLRRRLLSAAPTTGRRLRLVERLRVSSRVSVLLLECDGEVLVVGEHSGGLVPLRSATRATPTVELRDVAGR